MYPLCTQWHWGAEIDLFKAWLVCTPWRATPSVYWESQCKSCTIWAANSKHYTFIPHTHLTPVRANSTSWTSLVWRLPRRNPRRQPYLKVMTRFSQLFLQMAGKRRSSLSKVLIMNWMMTFPTWSLFPQDPILKRILIRMILLQWGLGRTPEEREESCQYTCNTEILIVVWHIYLWAEALLDWYMPFLPVKICLVPKEKKRKKDAYTM